jgi:hypothetical protein
MLFIVLHLKENITLKYDCVVFPSYGEQPSGDVCLLYCHLKTPVTSIYRNLRAIYLRLSCCSS